MRVLIRSLIVILGLLPAVAFAQDFDPSGRHSGRRPSGHTGRRPKPTKPRGKKVSPAVLIARYTNIVLKQPGAAFPLQKLTQLYRERDGKLDKLIAEFEQHAATAGPQQFNAKLALAGIYTHARRFTDAKKVLNEAAKAKPKLDTPRRMLAQLALQQNDRTEARKQFEKALPLIKKAIDKERIIRRLMVLCLELKDFDGATAYHKKLVQASRGSLYVKKELGLELLSRGYYQRAETELRRIVKLSAGDNRALAPALRDLGKALAKQNKLDEALKVLKRARTVAGKQSGIRREILVLLTDVFRDKGKLTELITILKSEKGRDFERLATIAALYEETGQVDLALKTYRDALKIRPKHIDVRVKLVHLLQTAGQLEMAIKEYEALIKSAPHNPDFVFQLADTLLQRGERDKAFKKIAELERRNQHDPDILAAVADFYERIEEPKRAIKVLEKLAKAARGDPQHLIDLGDRYFQAGNKKKAMDTWKRIRTVVSNRARAASLLGEVYLDHDMSDEALKAIREAVKLAPTNLRYRKALAVALERAAAESRYTRHRFTEALTIWEDLLKQAGTDKLLEREARTHIVSLWAVTRQLPNKVEPLRRKLNGTPPDLTAGRLLAEVQRRLRKLPDAEKTLRQIIKHAPGDESSMLALERILVMQRQYREAIKVLQQLVEANPRRARQYYQRMASYASELNRDDEAIKYATKAVELSPNDAAGHYHLAAMYRRRQDRDKAIFYLRKAIKQHDRLFPAYFELAELLLSAGKVDEADMHLRWVVRACRDEQFISRAAQESMNINLGKGTLEVLERELLPLALGNPQKPLYRRLLVKLYGAMTFPLVHAARFGNAAAQRTARNKLAKVGARAVKPLLDALADSQPAQQRIAIEVLAYVQNRGAGPALFNYAIGQAARELRVRAMVACGALADPSLLPRYRRLLNPHAEVRPGRRSAQSDEPVTTELAPGDAVAVAAAWALARINSPNTDSLLQSLLSSASPDVRALAAIGLGLSRQKRHSAALTQLVRSADAGSTARAAAVLALGELADRSSRPLLMALVDTTEHQVKLAALLALARIDASRGNSAALQADAAAIYARALLADQADVRRTAMAALTALNSGDFRRGATPLPVPDGAVIVSEVLRGFTPTGYSRSEQARALLSLRQVLPQAAAAAVATSTARASIVSKLATANLEPLFDAPASDQLPDQLRHSLNQFAESLAAACTPGFVALTRHPSVQVRKRAIEFLARRSEAEAQRAVSDALTGTDQDVCKTALSAIRQISSPQTIGAIASLLGSSDSWAIRARAAEALGRVSPTSSDAAKQQAVQALKRAATKDTYALVREAAVQTVANLDRSTAKAILDEVARSDPEQRLRELAQKLAAEKDQG